MPVTARTILQWTNSRLGTTYRASRRKTQGWTLWGYAYSLACLLIFDRMVLGCCLPNCQKRIFKSGANSSLTVEELCDEIHNVDSESKERLIHLLKDYDLEFCNFLPLEEFNVSSNKCREHWNMILDADCAALDDNNKFETIVSRIDCRQRYSVRWTCEDCKDAYKRFLCISKVLPLILPNNKNACTMESCKQVLKKCPYFLPNSDSQWSGQSVFECNLTGADAPDCIPDNFSSKNPNNVNQTRHQNTNGS